MTSQPTENPKTIYDFTVKDAKGNDVDLSVYKGKVLLIINVASKCGLTNSNYTELNQLYQQYKDQGLEVVAFPCNQFGDEEPGSNEEIEEFVCTRFKSEFPIFDKIEVNGDNAAPLYKFLKLGKWGFFGDDIQWNFTKFLVDRDGKVSDRYYPTTSPLSLETRDYRMASQPTEIPKTFYDFTVKDAKGNDADLSVYKGKVLLVINVASKCGLTNSNYTELNELYQKYKDQGLEILAFPCNQFGAQEPGSNEEIEDFVCTRFKSEFPIFDKIEVNGDNTAPVYKFLKAGKWGFFGDDIQWNFTKFLVDKDGKVSDRYYPTTPPLSIEHDIKKLLGVS
ncbi:hypothetical protein Pyn_05244 [Prunus yedoensis var. nudiflora]|uniref:Glutathione peroxidase n=1 Tax=Prunus yedoensis var. nudiflora TaxID=2094558 RepID=A0A314XUA2_PRUYE|nr:hypothetical protein Pyn_05244 [Prunus yedoensis var. nudiflora]